MHETHALTEILRVRPTSPLLQGLSEGELRVIADAGRVQTVAAGAHLYKQGDPARLLFLLTQGKVIFYRVTAGGRRSLLDASGPGGVVGSYSAVRDTYFFTAQALEETTTVVWDGKAVTQLVQTYPTLAVNALRVTVGRIFELTEICSGLTSQPVEQRLASALLRLSKKLGERMRISVRIKGVSEEELGAVAGTSLFTVNRVLRKWARQGVVRTGRRQILILRQDRLEEIAGKAPEQHSGS